MPDIENKWVRLANWIPDAPVVQTLTAVRIWTTLTRKQRQLVASCRVEVDPKAAFPDRYKVTIDGLTNAPAGTRRSLEAKGVVDERGYLTVAGIYTALWNHLEHDERRRERRNANREATNG